MEGYKRRAPNLSATMLSKFESYNFGGVEPVIFCLSPDEIENIVATYQALRDIENVAYTSLNEKFEVHSDSSPSTRVVLVLTYAEVQSVVSMYDAYMDDSEETMRVYYRFHGYLESGVDPIQLYLTGRHIQNFFTVYKRSKLF